MQNTIALSSGFVMEEIDLGPPKLKRYGPPMKKRFLELPNLLQQQKEALGKLAEWFRDDKKKDYTAVVSMPTGSGKSGIICCLPYYLGGSEIPDINLHKPILVIAPSLNIFGQLEDDLLRKPFLLKYGLLKPTEKELGYTVLPIMKTSDVKGLNNSAGQYDMVLSNAQKWRKIGRDNPTPNYEDLPQDLFSIIIVDEAHHLPADQWQEIIDKFRSKAKLVFLTATPQRCDRKEITTDGALSKVGYAYELSREKTVADKLIREIKFTILPKNDENVQDNKCPQPKKAEEDKDVAKKQVLVAIKRCMETKNQDFPLPGGKKHVSIIIAYNIDEATSIKDACIELFPAESVVVVHSKFQDNKRRIDGIKAGKYEVVIIVRMLLEGFDYPPFSIAGILTRMQSAVKFAQFIGRIQRLVRVKVNDDEYEIEENVKADVFTHVHFKQEEMVKKYIEPINPVDEDKSLDEPL